MAYSIQTAVSDGTLEVLDLSIKYMDKSHIFVYVDDVLVDGSAYSYVWLTDTRIQVVPAVANGSTLKVIRKTLTDEMWHEFSKGARFSTTSMDENFEQLLFLAQEYSEGIYVADFYSDIDLHLKRILNLGDPINDGDAVNLKTLKAYLPNAALLPPLAERITAVEGQIAVEEAKSTQLDKQGITLGNKTIIGFDATGLANGAWVHFAGRDTVGDGGGGMFRYSASSVQPADGGLVFAPAGGGRLLREGWTASGFNGPIDARWFGAKPDWNGTTGTDNAPAFSLAIAAGNSIHISGGRYAFGSTLAFPKDRDIEFFGDGMNITELVFTGSGHAITAIGTSLAFSDTARVRFRDFTLFRAASNPNAKCGFFVKYGTYYTSLRRVRVESFDLTGTFTDEGKTWNYSGIYAYSSWGADWERVITRNNRHGAILNECTGDYRGMDVQVNRLDGMIVQNSAVKILGGVFQGNDTENNTNNSATVENAEIKLISCIGAEVIGAFTEGEGTNPPYAIIVTGDSAAQRSIGVGISNCPITRSNDTARKRGAVLIDYAEETCISSNSIMPTSHGAGAETISHVRTTNNSKNTRVGRNNWRGRNYIAGVLYSQLPKIVDASGLGPAPIFSTGGGGLVTDNKRLKFTFSLPSIAATASVLGYIPGMTAARKTTLDKRAWLTGISLHSDGGISGGSVVVSVKNKPFGGSVATASLVLNQGPKAGTVFSTTQVPYRDALDPGEIYVQIDTSSFAPTAGNQFVIEITLEEDDSL